VTVLFLAPAGGPETERRFYTMNKYEVIVILSAKLEEEARTAALDKIKGYIERYNGKVGETEDWGKKRLAYEIQRETEGFYYTVSFEGDAETPNGLESHIRIMEPVLRYLVIRKDD